MKYLIFRVMKVISVLAILLLINITCESDSGITERIQPWPDNPHYLAWGNTPVFLLGATGYHGWTPISRLCPEDFYDQFHHLDRDIRDIGSPNVAPEVSYTREDDIMKPYIKYFK